VLEVNKMNDVDILEVKGVTVIEYTMSFEVQQFELNLNSVIV
jgi:hypothetical protein